MGETYWCEACEAYVAPTEVLKLGPSEGRTRVPACPRCRRHVRREEQRVKRPLGRVLSEGAFWPIGAHAAPAILASAVFVYLLETYARMFWIGPLMGLGAVLLQGATIVRATARGEDGMPSPYDVTGWGDLTGTVVRYFVVLGLGTLPVLAGLVVAEGEGPLAQGLVALAGGLLGALYLPAALVRAATAETFLGAVEPVTPLRIVLRFGTPYFIAATWTWLTAVCWLVAATIVDGLTWWVPRALPVDVIAIALRVCGLFAVSRVLGLVVREQQHEVGLEV